MKWSIAVYQYVIKRIHIKTTPQLGNTYYITKIIGDKLLQFNYIMYFLQKKIFICSRETIVM